MIDDVLFGAEERMEGAVSALHGDLMGIRTGRATPALVDKIRVEVYDSVMPLNQVATVSVPEPRLLMIRPWDASSIGAIQRAILKSDIGLTPNNDGKVIRLAIPPLTDERRRDLAKMLHRRAEEARVSIRNVRRDAMKELADLEKSKEIAEDDHYRARDQLQTLTDDYVKTVDAAAEAKEAEIMEV
jgi:ribosome recycling factor